MNDEITLMVGRRLYSFDGRVLEIFGGEDAVRYHVRNMYVRVTGPDRKGKRVVEIGHGKQPDSRGGGHVWRYTAEEWDEVRGLGEFLETVRTAAESV
ncbi:hypothetical protein ABZX85_35390 [Streptomyces sp. NPDC004539]|uniref:hypothetical protein n=1 Tax=Streptomyces sp. NPDC004539 TaxID=3154280 RepID=UPI0033B459D8